MLIAIGIPQLWKTCVNLVADLRKKPASLATRSAFAGFSKTRQELYYKISTGEYDWGGQ
jgi:hypothetical protein